MFLACSQNLDTQETAQNKTNVSERRYAHTVIFGTVGSSQVTTAFGVCNSFATIVDNVHVARLESTSEAEPCACHSGQPILFVLAVYRNVGEVSSIRIQQMEVRR